jgi:hypothetical protein
MISTPLDLHRPRADAASSLASPDPDHLQMRSTESRARTRRPRRRRCISRLGQGGAVLFEVIVAMALLAGSGLAAVSMAAEAVGAVTRARQAEARMREAARLMDAVSLWPREDLDRRLGDRREGPFILRIQRPDPELYTAALADSASRRVLLATSIFRRDTTDALP